MNLKILNQWLNYQKATATANSDINGSITDVTVTANGLEYSAPIGIVISGTSVSTSINAGNTLISETNEDQSTRLTPYNKIAINHSGNIFTNQEVIEEETGEPLFSVTVIIELP